MSAMAQMTSGRSYCGERPDILASAATRATSAMHSPSTTGAHVNCESVLMTVDIKVRAMRV